MQLIKIIIQNNSRSITLKSAFEQNILYFPDNFYVCFLILNALVVESSLFYYTNIQIITMSHYYFAYGVIHLNIMQYTLNICISEHFFLIKFEKNP